MSPDSTGTRSGSTEETEQLGRDLARDLAPGDLVLLKGEVGTGKSTLARAAMRELGVEGAIPSPTFTIGRSYQGRTPISHLDLHRVGSIDAEDPGLLNEYFGPEKIVFVEWPGESEADLTASAMRIRSVRLSHAGGDSRRIEVGAATHTGRFDA
ncbi:MAG: tRNA (adenosine(37)-N6)-threonylcarbamoyltransferase complex ATPase subunit type 1 TsaE [Solirubrobacterales bacterium]|nr:tRNA (adenosine(37)-N6)-threonylcarbamoyltransferase complex ATPase subunit type 1 TsaE [Solirubrobacterales bacterium]